MTAFRVEREINSRKLSVVAPYPRIFEIVTGNVRDFRDQVRVDYFLRLGVQLDFDLCSFWQASWMSLEQFFFRLGDVKNDLKFQETRALDDLARPFSIDRPAGDLHQHPVRTLACHHRLRDARDGVIDAAAQDFEHLEHRALANLLLPFVRQDEVQVVPARALFVEDIRVDRHRPNLFSVLWIRSGELERFADYQGFAWDDTVFFEELDKTVALELEFALERRFEFNAEDPMDPAL